ncbi:piezo-type mechanosensitive ion channel component-like isoform X2 [Ornithodoros turicata]|uniref:piezo-type mechanosensitive ion channel component-like isoform X2 n=1 Tax=Ornithodoros turicata TaxID=34597 RepID=UPI00313A3A32
MVKVVIAWMLYRIVLPIVLLSAVLLRYNVISLLYLLLLLANPLTSSPTVNRTTAPAIYLKVILATCAVVHLCHIGYHVFLLATAPQVEELDTCSKQQRLLAVLGIDRLEGLTLVQVFRLFGLDLVVFVVAGATLFCCPRLDNFPTEHILQPPQHDRSRLAGRFFGASTLLFLMAAAGSFRCSLLSMAYFLTFLFVGTCLALHRHLDDSFSRRRFLLLLYSGLHIVMVYFYQLDYAQELIPPTELQWRLLGLPALRKPICDTSLFVNDTASDVRALQFHDQDWITYAECFAVIALFYVAAIMTRTQMLQPSVSKTERPSLTVESSILPCEADTKAQTNASTTSNYVDADANDLDEDIFLSCNTNKTENKSLRSGMTVPCCVIPPVPNSARSRKWMTTLCQYLTLLSGASHVLTLVAMMAWSITYASWLTFVFLLWSCILWMTSNTRRACLRTSPALVAYAELLLLLQYVFSFNVTDTELPQFSHLGLIKYHESSYRALFGKMSYTIVFWITLYQYMDERHRGSPSDISGAHKREPCHDSGPILNMDADAADTQPKVRRRANPKHWCFSGCGLWFPAISLGLVALGGSRVVVYRVVYLFFFLVFLLMFQLSYNLCVEVMYCFWMAVVIYTMTVLVLVYTYQFERFPSYWEEYLHVPPDIQRDLGLEKYSTYDMCMAFLVPTSVLIIAVWQLNWLREDSLKANQGTYTKQQGSERGVMGEQCGVQGAHVTDVSGLSIGLLPQAIRDFLRSWTCMDKLRKFLNDAREVSWRLLEVHVNKIVFFCVTYVSVYDVCVPHLFFVVFVVLALPSPSLQLLFSHCCSLWASILFLVRTIYQLGFVGMEYSSTNCAVPYGHHATESSTSPLNATQTNAMWFGLRKTSNYFSYCKPYMVLVLVFTAQAIVRHRQDYHRAHHGVFEPKPGVVFSFVARRDADNSIPECAMFLVNCFFYKFGIEVSFVVMVFCMGQRMDVYALVTSIWLCVLFLLRTHQLSRIWPCYVTYLCVVMLLQYIAVVGLPPELCVGYPWSDPSRKTLHEAALWLYLPDYKKPPDPSKILVDHLQLMVASCQLFAFSLERSQIITHHGGSNAEIYDKHGRFVGISPNPVPDFVTYATSYLSVIQSCAFFSSYWMTLAVMFLAGTSRVSVFAVGYVLGCLAFLWSGSDFFLRPMNTLLKEWNMLLAYNVAVIFFKNVAQVAACVFQDYLLNNACWIVHVLGIVCLKSEQPELQPSGESNENSDGVRHAPSPSEVGLFWDGVCLAFLLAQKRLFTSYYFQHIVIEVLVQQHLASRGSEMINEMEREDFEQQRNREQEHIEKIRLKTEKLRVCQQQLRPGDERLETHYEAIRSGDHYMFDEPTELELDMEAADGKGRRMRDEDEDVEVRGLNAFLTSAMKSDNLRRDPRELAWCRLRATRRAPTTSESSLGSKEAHPLIPATAKSETAHTAEISKRPSAAETAGLPPTGSRGREPREERLSRRLLGHVAFLMALIDSMLITCTAKLNEVSRDYRYVVRRLGEEKRLYKMQYTSGLATETNKVHTASPTHHFHERYEETQGSSQEHLPESCLLGAETSHWGSATHRPSVVRFFVACYYAVMSHSEVACYLAIVVNQMMTASLLSLPLPLMAFLWGSLSVPRPSKTFWITVITYTEAIVVVKYIFQFDTFDWRTSFIVGIAELSGHDSSYAFYDLVLLLFVFLHRFVLRTEGLWRDSTTFTDASEASSMSCATLTLHAMELPEENEGVNTSTEESRILRYSTLHASDIFRRVGNYTVPFKTFFVDLLHPTHRIPADVYAYMFVCDFVSLFIFLLGSSTYSEGSTTVDNGAENGASKGVLVPLLMILAQLSLVIVDRAFYLRKYVLGKLVLHIFIVLAVHVWLFFVVPALTRRAFVDDRNATLQLWYFIKYMFVPFLYELRSLMDWLWTDTSLSLSYWLKVEDIFSTIFFVKCMRRAEMYYPTPRGQNRGSLTKYGLGGIILLGIIIVVWSPLMLSVLSNSAGESLLPSQFTMELQIGSYEPLFKVSLQGNALQPMPSGAWLRMQRESQATSGGQIFMNDYDRQDVAVVTIHWNSTGFWAISPPARKRLIEELNLSAPGLQMSIKWEITRVLVDDFNKTETQSTRSTIQVVPLSDSTVRQEFARAISGDDTSDVIVRGVLPNYLMMSDGKLEVVILDHADMYRDFTLRLRTGSFDNKSAPSEWWELEEQCSKGPPYPFLSSEQASCSHLRMIVFCEKVKPDNGGQGIIGLYATFVLLVSSLLRGFWATSAFKIMIDDVPNVDRILQLCHDIYLVRQSRELLLEEYLLAKLLFLCRSPEALIKWTRPLSAAHGTA